MENHHFSMENHRCNHAPRFQDITHRPLASRDDLYKQSLRNIPGNQVAVGEVRTCILTTSIDPPPAITRTPFPLLKSARTFLSILIADVSMSCTPYISSTTTRMALPEIWRATTYPDGVAKRKNEAKRCCNLDLERMLQCNGGCNARIRRLLK